MYKLFTFFIFLMHFLSINAEDDNYNDSDLLNNMKLLVSDDDDIVSNAINNLAKTGDPRLEDFFEFYRNSSLYIWNDKIVVCEETIEDEDFNELAPLITPLDKQPILDITGIQVKPDILELIEVSPSRKHRIEARNALILLTLSSPDNEYRLSAVKKSGMPPYNYNAIPVLKIIQNNDNIEKIRFTAKESFLLLSVSLADSNKNKDQMMKYLEQLVEINSLRSIPVIESLKKKYSKDKATEVLLSKLHRKIIKHQKFINQITYVFQGLSLGSILIIMALGLAITFGLMGIINMAHGELMMIGGFSTYIIQEIFVRNFSSEYFDYYFLVALPSSFIISFIVGLIIEFTVVQKLYRRPLESLLATWGISIILIQTTRLIFGDNIGVNSPEFLRGGYEVMNGLILPYNRLFIIIMCIGALILIYYLFGKTSLGLKVKATMQNRDMATALGVNTRAVDRFTFAFGSGLAGIAGCCLTLIGGVTPDMGQNYIVESFLVVVTGGVGELLGVICSGFGIGILTKILEPMNFGDVEIGAIWSKVLVLIFVVIFIQFKPSGLFPPKGRLADD